MPGIRLLGFIPKVDRIVHALRARPHMVLLQYASTVTRLDRLEHHRQPLDLNILFA